MISNNVGCANINIKLLREHHLEFLTLKMGCRGLSESTLVRMPYCWKSHVAAHMVLFVGNMVLTTSVK